jgi:hypothetical protein
MHTEEILHKITKPFILAGIYKDEKSALTDITLDYNASLEIEDDWMEWKSAIEMRQSWKNANKMISVMNKHISIE